MIDGASPAGRGRRGAGACASIAAAKTRTSTALHPAGGAEPAGIVQHQHRPAIGEDRLLLGNRQAPIDRHEDRADPHGGLLQDQQVGAVAGDRRDPLSGFHAVAFFEDTDGALDALVQAGIGPATPGCEVDAGRSLRLRPGM